MATISEKTPRKINYFEKNQVSKPAYSGLVFTLGSRLLLVILPFLPAGCGLKHLLPLTRREFCFLSLIRTALVTRLASANEK